VQTTDLKDEIRRLKDELADLTTTKKMETREIEHLVKIKEEKLNIEHEKKTVELTAEFQKKEMAMQTKYHDKVVTQIEGYNGRQDKFFDQVMKRLPNVNVQLGEKKEKK
jgi:hypothetical protein